MGIKLVVLDCDLTLWDYRNATDLNPPFTRVDNLTVADATGVRVRLLPGARELLEELRRRGLLISIASWNRPEPVFAIFEQLQLTEFFVFPKVQFHPRKERMIAAILRDLAKAGQSVRHDQIVYVDDNPKMLERVRAAFPAVRALQAGVAIKDLREVLGHLDHG